MADGSVNIRPNARLDECPLQQVNLGLPSPLNQRLNALVDMLYEERTTKRELVGALILAAPEDPTQLSSMIHSYRRARACDAGLSVSNAGGSQVKVLALHRGKPGPRSRRKPG